MFFFPSYEAAFPSASSSSTLACSKACFLGLRTVWYLEKKRTIIIFNYMPNRITLHTCTPTIP